MSDLTTFRELARALAEAGAAGACATQASLLEARLALEPAARLEALRSAARGLRLAARILSRLGRSGRAASFHPVGVRGALAAGHVALAEGSAAQAELVGEGLAEAAPRSAAGLRLVGQALFAQGRHGLAVRALRGALAKDPRDPFTRALHGEALWFAGERVAARCALELVGAGGGPDALGAALGDAIRCGALERAGRTP
jgi:Flp pilus assembly protein TadD